ncbi:M48 family metallopeptidase [Desulfatitalea alkaliphila]|uniref:M48 family metallopeptidase n=1 Tax=Desulfatitalea alkaliphila TaxID=2929485 RepID=A0AA41R4U1_9BACT|nr:M48 family metallopeptidase [Desulfatitalea alkaliphila]MCJ8500816.1 M48 family metallopeptidase [Desulfatitalea alkaliphila]
MNFFEHQARARRRTGLLILLFVLAVLAIVAGVNFAMALAMGLMDNGWQGLAGHKGVLTLITLGTLALVGGATAYRVARLGSGGSAVADALGATPVPPETSDLQTRRLRNVVEETALAAGVSVPAIYVMEKEAGINAFAAGYGPADAVVAVTRGTLNHLNREELQGVVAHEFSHIVNGDMRLNIRLMGVLFGILVIGIIGRILLRGGRFGRIRGNNRNAGGIVLLGLALYLLGGIGVFFGRLIKASVSRQREFLADAAAVQFTRQPTAIAGALKKIAALEGGSRLQAPDTEEVSHMLFADGVRSLIGLWATHPPLEKRIRAIEPGFQAEEIETLRKQLGRGSVAAGPEQPVPERRKDPLQAAKIPGMGGGAIPQAVVMGTLLADVDQPDPGRQALAARLRRKLPPALYAAAHDSEAVVPLLLSLLLGDQSDLRGRQLSLLQGRISVAGMTRVSALAPLTRDLDPRHRLPLLALSMPTLRRRTPESLKALLPLVDELVQADGRVTVFEYALGRLLARHVNDVLAPGRARTAGRTLLKQCGPAVADLFSVIAALGHGDETAARQAFHTGLAVLYGARNAPDYNPPRNWIAALDGALQRLDGLSLSAKEELIKALVATMMHDGRITVAEGELLRTVCGLLHVPLPPLVSDGA